jgi:hypothetical protein
MSHPSTSSPLGGGLFRLLVLDTSDPDDPKWLIATVTLPSDVRPAEMEPGGRRYKNWPEVVAWVTHQAGHPVSLIPLAGMVWRVDEPRFLP